jgi:hypothetical protein
VTDRPEFASLLLDAGAVLAIAQDRQEVRRWLQRAQTQGIDPRVTLVTTAEVFRDGTAGARVRWVLSLLDEEALDDEHAKEAGRLLGRTNSGDRTIDALVAAAALRMPRPVVVLTSDPKDLGRLLEGQRRVVVVRV